MTRSLPPQPNCRYLQEQAKDLLKSHKSGNAEVCATLRLLHRFRDASDREILDAKVALQEVQLALAMDYGFGDWAELIANAKSRVPSDEEGPERREQKEMSARSPHLRGDCSISGTVIDDETGKPVSGGRVYLHYTLTADSIHISPASDGSFEFKDIPAGRYSLRTVHVPGYQDCSHNPENRPGVVAFFTLTPGEQLPGLVFRLKASYQISGRVFGDDGKPLKGLGEQPASDLCVVAWLEDPSLIPLGFPGGFRTEQQAQLREDGTYLLDFMDGRPMRVALADWRAAQQEEPYPHCYAPGTFAREDARLVTFENGRVVENVDIAARRKGGLVLEGVVVAADTGKPLPQALVAIHHIDMWFDPVTAYTDAQGRYRMECLGPGNLLTQVDASPDGYVRTTKVLSLEKSGPPKRLNFSLQRGVRISGAFVDESGKEIAPVRWCARGSAFIVGAPEEGSHYGGYANRRAAKTVISPRAFEGLHFRTAEGDYGTAGMRFPSAGSFVIEGMLPGLTSLRYDPRMEGVEVRRIMYQGRDVLESGIPTKAGDKIEGVSIVLSQPSPDAG